MNQQFEPAAAGAARRATAAPPQTTRQIVLVSRPRGMPEESNFALRDAPLPQPGRGEVLVRILYLSVDPYMRGKMRETVSYTPPFELNQPLAAGAVGRVVESRSPGLKAGDIVYGMLGWADYWVAKAKDLCKLNPKIAPVTTALGVLGMPGLTAYVGMLDIGQPKKGETAVISGAAGAVGSVAGQIARIKGCRVVGIAGSDAKLEFLRRELGFDAAINYKTGDISQALRRACPEGVDIYFDNVGGPITDAVLAQIRHGARIIICGQISMYNRDEPEMGPRPYPLLLVNSALMKGFIVYDYQERHSEALAQLVRWVKAGKIKYRETIVEGLENAPKAFIGLFKGENIGKQIVKVPE